MVFQYQFSHSTGLIITDYLKLTTAVTVSVIGCSILYLIM